MTCERLRVMWEAHDEISGYMRNLWIGPQSGSVGVRFKVLC